MKKKVIKISIIIIISIALFLTVGIGWMVRNSIGFHEGIYLKSSTGSHLVIMDNSPIVMKHITNKKDAFEDLQTGDKIFVIHDGIEESYPRGTGVYFYYKTGLGEVPKSVIEELTEMGWLTGGKTSETEENKEEKWDVIPMVMVNDTLYLTTGYESTIDGRCGVMDGKIESSVDGTEIPTKNNQSNFGDGYEYQYGAIEGTIEIYMNGSWWIYATEEAREEMQFGDK